ncbi:serine hydrolase [Parvularcula marina]|nr:serine hydrolase [Parvularcula marina]
MSARLSALAGLGLVMSVSACATSAAPAPQPPLAIAGEMDTYIEEGMDAVGIVPGLAVAIYTPDGVYLRSFGVTNIETGEPVTTDTAFYIASSTKSFTAMAMAILDDRGEIDLDQTLTEFAPDAPFPAEVRPDEVTLRSLLTHTSGIRNNPIVYRVAFTGQHTPEKTWELLGRSQANENAPLGTFQYTNVGYNILTILTDRKLGVNWQDLLAEELFEPTGMEETTAYMSVAKAPGRSLAEPHFGGMEGGPVITPLEKIDATMQSAGGMVLSASDALRWLEFMVEGGVVDGERIAPEAVVVSTRVPLAEANSEFDAYTRESYGLGWYNSTYKGQNLVHHFGGYAGFRAHISYIPEEKIGVAVLMNEIPVAAGFPEAVANHVYDLMLDPETADTDGKAAIAAAIERRDRIIASVTADRERRSTREWQLTQPRSAYTGSYSNEDYGTADITIEGDDLRVTIGNLSSVAEPFTREDSIRVEMVPFSGDVIQFVMGADGVPTSFNYDGDVYTRQ